MGKKCRVGFVLAIFVGVVLVGCTNPDSNQQDAVAQPDIEEQAWRADPPPVVQVQPQFSWQLPPNSLELIEGYVELDEARLWYLDSGGDGVPVILVHPNSGSALVWPYQFGALVEEGYRVIAYSRRGHYGSEVENAEASYSGYSDLDALVNQLGLTDFHLLGIAAGADLVPDYSLAFPDRVRSLVIGSTIGRPGDPAYRASDATLLPPEFSALPVELKELSPTYRAAFPEGAREWIRLANMSRPQRVVYTAAQQVTPDALASIEKPVMLFTGDSDFYMPPSRLRAYSRYWADPEVYLFLDAGHAPQWEQPEAFNKQLVEFLKRADREFEGGFYVE